MKKTSFFYWYYTEGLGNLWDIEKNYIKFFLRLFSVADLSRTLFYPWKRDFTFRYWRGVSPLKALQTFINNFISRFIGAIVRLIVIILGLSMTLLFIAFCVIFNALWIFPLSILMVFGALNMITVLIFLLLGFLYLISPVIIYKENYDMPYQEMSLLELRNFKWFDRVFNRIGKGKEEVETNIIDDQNLLESYLRPLELEIQDFNFILRYETIRQQVHGRAGKFWLWENLELVTPIGRQWKYAYTPHLDNYALDLTDNDPTEYNNISLIGRQKDLELVTLALKRSEQNNILLVGNTGSGRMTLVHYLAKLIRLNRCEEFFKSKRILLLDLGRLVSDCHNEGKDSEGVLRSMFQEAAYAGNVILAIKNLENYINAEVYKNHPGIFSVMEEFLDAPTFQIIATSTQSEYHHLIEGHKELMKYFETVELSEPTEEETVRILLQKFEGIEKERVVFTYSSIKKIISYSGQFHWDMPLPERAIDFAEEILLYWQSNPAGDFIDSETVDGFISLKTKMPHGKIGEGEKEKLLNLEKILHERVVGQEEAVEKISEAMRRVRTGVGNPKRPIGGFLFLGPTGVGKTETAKALAEAYFGDEERMIRLDMSEFQNPSSVERLIGSNLLNQPGQLVSKVKDNPYSILLLDEIEKAYSKVLDLFLQILDEGYLTDGFGEKINFRNLIIIATSNAESQLIKNLTEEGEESEKIRKEVVDAAVRDEIFRLEFLNRFDGIIYFRPLSGDELKKVAELLLVRVSKRIEKEKNLEVSFGEGVAEKVVSQGYEPTFGARSIYRYIEDKIEDLVARKIINGEAQKGGNLVIMAEDIK